MFFFCTDHDSDSECDNPQCAAAIKKENKAIRLHKEARDLTESRIKRHPDLVRLTGRHPFNCEPPLPALKAAGFITPPSLHYVRNHGAVPVKYVAPHCHNHLISSHLRRYDNSNLLSQQMLIQLLPA